MVSVSALDDNRLIIKGLAHPEYNCALGVQIAPGALDRRGRR